MYGWRSWLGWKLALLRHRTCSVEKCTPSAIVHLWHHVHAGVGRQFHGEGRDVFWFGRRRALEFVGTARVLLLLGEEATLPTAIFASFRSTCCWELFFTLFHFPHPLYLAAAHRKGVESWIRNSRSEHIVAHNWLRKMLKLKLDEFYMYKIKMLILVVYDRFISNNQRITSTYLTLHSQMCGMGGRRAGKVRSGWKSNRPQTWRRKGPRRRWHAVWIVQLSTQTPIVSITGREE